MADLYAQLAELLEVDEVKPVDVLDQFAQWDSLTILSLLATLDSDYGVNLTADDVRGARTAEALVNLVARRRTK